MEIHDFFLLSNSSRKIEEIPLNEIMYLEGSANYTLIHLISGKIKVSSRTMSYHIKNSINGSFLRIHKSFCVNTVYISPTLNKYRDNIKLTNGTELAVARRRKGIFKQIYLN